MRPVGGCTFQIGEHLILLLLDDLQRCRPNSPPEAGRKPCRGRVRFDLADEFVAALLLKLPYLRANEHRACRVGGWQEASGSAQNGTESLAILKAIAARIPDLAIDRYRLTDVLPIGDLMNRQNVAGLEGNIGVRVGSRNRGSDLHCRRGSRRLDFRLLLHSW